MFRYTKNESEQIIMTNAKTKTNVSKQSKIENEKQRKTKINALLTSLKNATQRHEKCRLRNQLRKLQHYGALRNRTFFDKTTNKTIIVEKSKTKNA